MSLTKVTYAMIEGTLANVLDYGADATGVADSTAAIQAAVNAGEQIYLPVGTYRVDGTITLTKDTQLLGAGKTNTIITKRVNENNPAFEYDTTGETVNTEQVVSIRFADLRINAKKCVKFNESGDYNTVFKTSYILSGITIERCQFEGWYESGAAPYEVTDPDKGTNVVPVISTMLGYGYAVYAAKCFYMSIRDSDIRYFGIGLYLDGCDSSEVQNNILNLNGIAIDIYGHDTFGWQVKVLDSAIVYNWRRGWVTIGNAVLATATANDYVGATTIKNTYFGDGGSNASSEYIRTQGDIGSIIDGNRFDQTTNVVGTPLIYFAPRYADLITNNVCNPAAPATTISVSADFWEGRLFATFSGNSREFPVPTGYLIQSDFAYQSPYRFSEGSFPNGIAGNGVVSYPIITSPVTGIDCLQTTTNSILLEFKVADPAFDRFLIRYAGRNNVSGAAAGFRIVKIIVASVSTTLSSGYVNSASGFVDQTGIQTVIETFQLPNSIVIDASSTFITVELTNTEVEYYSIEIEPTNVLLTAAAPSGGTTTYYVGDQAVNYNPVVGQPKGWMCTVTGAPGTWVSTGNL